MEYKARSSNWLSSVAATSPIAPLLDVATGLPFSSPIANLIALPLLLWAMSSWTVYIVTLKRKVGIESISGPILFATHVICFVYFTLGAQGVHIVHIGLLLSNARKSGAVDVSSRSQRRVRQVARESSQARN